MAYIKKRTHTVRETRMVLRGNLQYIQRDIGYIEKMVAHGVSLSLLGNDLYRKLLVIQELCRQQWDMYVRKSHQIEDRIVSIDQPHVRPIVRGKAGCPTEFGAKVIVGLVSGYAFLMKADWNNYSESRSLKQVVEEYEDMTVTEARDAFAQSSGYEFEDLMGGSPGDPLTGTNEKGEYLSFFVAAGGGADSYAVSWRYPAEAAEGFGARLPTIAETFLAS